LATSGRPSTAETREAAARLGLDAGRAHVISMREAILAGQAVFGPVLEEG
jgi:hypothetical protein